MIDWLSLLIPCPHTTPVDGGKIWVIDPDGSVRESLRWAEAEGSHCDKVRVRSHGWDSGAYQYLYVSGNPAKFFQGHNLIGPECVDLVRAFGQAVFELIKVPGLAIAEGREWFINRIDITRMYDLGTDSDCHAWLKAAEQRVTVKHRGRGVLDRGTFYVGKHSQRSSLKIYAKGPEFRRRKPRPESNLPVEKMKDWAVGKLRFETVWRRKELERRGLRELSMWTDELPSELFESFISQCGLDMRSGLDVSEIRELPPAWRGIYHQWLAGVDLPQIMSRATWYRWRKRFIALGLDIAADPPQAGEVIPFVRTLEAVPATVPHWLAKTAWQQSCSA